MTPKPRPKKGDHVRYIGPTLFESFRGRTGTVVREPLTIKTAIKGRADNFRYMVQIGARKDGRPKLMAMRETDIELV